MISSAPNSSFDSLFSSTHSRRQNAWIFKIKNCSSCDASLAHTKCISHCFRAEKTKANFKIRTDDFVNIAQSSCHGRAQRNVKPEVNKKKKYFSFSHFCAIERSRGCLRVFSPSQISAFFFSSESHRDNIMLMHNAQTHRLACSDDAMRYP